MKIFLKIIVILFVAGATFVGLAFYAYQNDINTLVGTEQAKVFIIKEGEGASSVAARLESENLIKSKWSMIVYLELNNLSSSIKAGTYSISGQKNLKEIIKIITEGDVANRKVTIPEGLTIPKVAKIIDKAEVAKESEFLGALKETYDLAFVKEIPKGLDLEGYLFPETYFFPFDYKARDVVMSLLKTFESKITGEIRAGFGKYGLNLHEGITLASMVEVEGRTEEERKVIAGILLNRLKIGMKLQVDATVNYATGKSGQSPTHSDLQIDSPYNTYKYVGLPPGPIASPGIISIKASSFPTITDYYFYCHDKNGKIYYGRNDAEHQQNRLKCLAP